MYVCTEDTEVAEEWWCTNENQSKNVPDNIAELELLGFSKSVIDAAANDLYTPEQIDTLKSQKRHLHETNAACAFEKENINPKSRSDSVTTRAVQPQWASENFATSPLGFFQYWNNSKPLPPVPNDKCRFQCCHNCRPHSADRTFISFDAVFAGEFRPINQWDPASLPVNDVNIVRNLGLRPVTQTVPVDDLMDKTIQRDDDSDESELYWDDGGWLRRSQEEHERIKRLSGNEGQSGTAATSSLGMKLLRSRDGNGRRAKQHRLGGKDVDAYDEKPMENIPVHAEDRQQRKRELQEMATMIRLVLQNSSDFSPRVPASSTTIADKQNGYDENAEGVDVGLFRHGMEVSADTQLHATPRTACQKDDEMDSEDLEGKVEGGIALTEEAAETCTADIITTL